ncbi:MAG: hypothetical protein A2Y14_02090 [Verrucomicrobia bacterium GWF2_51_19]|nr:MAG: hypothetical protein A2Y14_02090 [Verrucomicrobia bacterium GWF2_51_19]HCJ12041.1 hypothetical protein [Opitutae bacterium]
MISAFSYFIETFATLFVATGTLSVIPLFISMTPEYSAEERMKTVRTAIFVAVGVLLFFVLTGQYFFDFLGISMDSFRIAGGILIFVIGFDMLRSQDPNDNIKKEGISSKKAGSSKDLAITPLAVPMMVGPGCISASILRKAEAANQFETILFFVCVFVFFAAFYILFHFASNGAKWLRPMVLRLSYRLSGLVLTAMAIQFIIDGFLGIRVSLAAAAKLAVQ